jgi:hypothetical protein
MNRTSALIGTAAAAAALVAGSVAAVAAVNTAASAAPPIDSIAVVDDQPLAVGSLAPIDIAPLPEIVPISAQAPVIANNTSVAASPSAKSGQASSKPTMQTSATPVSQSARSMTADQAAAIVMDQIDGSAKVAEVSRTEHSGYDSWAVMVDKADGSRLVGYVFTGATGADVFDWKVLKEPRPIVVTAPATNASAAAKPSKGSYNDDDDEYESEHESEHDESHEGDDDDD